MLQRAHHIAIQGMSVVRSSRCKENFHIFTQGQKRKHFRKICLPETARSRQFKVKPFFANEQRSMRDIATKNNNRTPLCRAALREKRRGGFFYPPGGCTFALRL